MEEDSALAESPVRRPVGWRHTISPERDLRQAQWLVWVMGMALATLVGLQIFLVVGMGHVPWWFLFAVTGSAGFAALVWRMRASTAAGAALGGTICLRMLLMMRFDDEPFRKTAVPELIVLFGMTFAATRFGRWRGEASERGGRRASQVVANLGVAGVLAGSLGWYLAGLAALAEAAADTVSSEMGQALGGRAFSLTTLQQVEAGMDGGVSLVGSICGCVAAGLVAGVAVGTGAVDGISGVVIFVAGCGGMVFDSLLGATVERLGWLGNDLVNFTSTLFAAGLAWELARYVVPPQPYW